MREFEEKVMPDTEPYHEWLAVLGSILVIAVGAAILFAQGAFT